MMSLKLVFVVFRTHLIAYLFVMLKPALIASVIFVAPIPANVVSMNKSISRTFTGSKAMDVGDPVKDAVVGVVPRIVPEISAVERLVVTPNSEKIPLAICVPAVVSPS